MTPKERAAMQQALEALELFGIDDMAYIKSEKAITALREALDHSGEANEMVAMNLNCKSVQARLATLWGYVKAEQAEQEPVAWIEIERGIPMFVRFSDKYKPNCDGFIPLYDAAIRTKDLTDDEIADIRMSIVAYEPVEWGRVFARAVIAADREKNK